MTSKRPVVLFYILTISTVLFLVHIGSRTTTVLAQNTPPNREHCIIIDPGHGGEDGGATSCSGKLESSYNLEIASRLNDLFHLLGYSTRMIRTEDVSIYTSGSTLSQKKLSDLKERVRICNETPGSILVSIHQNIYPDSKYHGAQVLYANSKGSKQLASQLQSLLIETINPGSRRQIKQGTGLYIMEHVSCPGILVECGFLSNPQEDAMLKTAEYQQQICCVIVSAVSVYLSNT